MPEKDCPDDLICELCGTKWKEKSQLNTLETIYQTCTNIQNIVNEAQTAIYHGFFTVQCPRCGIPIKKNGGCDHMTCRKCTHEFCWICKQDHLQHSTERCAAFAFVKSAIVFVFLLHIGMITGTHIVLYNIVTSGVRFLFRMFVFNITFMMIILLIFSLICLWKERECIHGNKKKLLWYISWFGGMAYLTSWHIPNLVNNHADEMLWALGTETAIVGVISSCYFVVQTWLKFVL